MSTFTLPAKSSIVAVAKALERQLGDGSRDDAIVIELPRGTHVGCGALAFLGAWGCWHRSQGRRVLIRGQDDVVRALARMDLHALVGAEPPAVKHRRPEAGCFLPLRTVADAAARAAIVDAIARIVWQQFDEASTFLPALYWAVNEIADNIVIHAESPVPGVVCAQYLPAAHRLEIGICDVGRGLQASLATTRRVPSHGEALSLALERGVTRDPEVGQGNGMAGAKEIVRVNGGQLEVWTGDVCWRLREGRDDGFVSIPALQGTGVFFSLDTRRAVDLGDTWIGDAGWMELLSLRIENAGGLRVVDHCASTLERSTAKGLRAQAEMFLAQSEEALVLDFDGIPHATSSFLDELCGRLAAKVGRDAYVRRVKVANATEIIERMIGSVVTQRLGAA